MENIPNIPPNVEYVAEPIQQKPLYNNFLEAGREGKNEWWRYLIGIILSFFVGYCVIGILPLLGLAIRGNVLGYFRLEEALSNDTNLQSATYLHVSKNVLLTALLFIFVGGLFFLWIAVRYIHSKKFISIITSNRQPFSFRRYFFAFFLYLLLSAISLTISYFSQPESFELVFEPLPFLGTLLICILFLPIQTGWEELFFRGYLMQGLGLWMKKPIVPLIITSLIFGLLHMSNKEVAVNGVAVMLPQYILPGFIFGAIVLLDERLELAMGLHLANNLFGIVMVSSPEMTIQANSLWKVPTMGGTENFILGILPLLIVIMIFWKIYKWKLAKLYR